MATNVKANNSLAPSESGGPSPLSELSESANNSASVEPPIEESTLEESAPEESLEEAAPEEEAAEEEAAPEEAAAEEEAAPEEAASARNNNYNKQNEVEASAPGVEIPAVAAVTNNKTRKAVTKKGSTGMSNPEIAAKVAELKTAMAAKGINPGNAILRQAFFHYMRLKQSGTEEDEAIRARDALIEEKMAEAQQPKKGKCPPLPADLDWGSVKDSLRRDFDGFLDGLEKKVSAWLTRKSKRSGEVVPATRMPKSAKAPKASKAPKKSNSRNSVYEALTRKRSNNNGKQYYKRPPKNLTSAVRRYRNAHPSQSTKAAVKEYMLAKEIANKKARSNKSKAARAAKKVTIKSPSPAANNLGSVARSNE
jgi:hypothetical protein